MTDEQMKAECIRMIEENSDYLMQPIYEAVKILTGSGRGLEALKGIIIRDVVGIESERTISCISSFIKGLTGTWKTDAQKSALNSGNRSERGSGKAATINRKK